MRPEKVFVTRKEWARALKYGYGRIDAGVPWYRSRGGDWTRAEILD